MDFKHEASYFAHPIKVDEDKHDKSIETEGNFFSPVQKSGTIKALCLGVMSETS